MKQLFTNAVLSGLIVIISFITTLYLTQVLDIEVYGKYEYLIGIAGVFSIILNLGIDVHGSRLLAESEDEVELVGILVIFRLISFAMIFILGTILMRDLAFAIVALNIGALGMSSLFEYRQRLHLYNSILLGERLCFLVAILVIRQVYNGIFSIDILLTTFFIISVLGIWIQFKLLKLRFSTIGNIKRLRIGTFGLSLILIMLAQLVEFFNTGFVKVIINNILGLHEVAKFSLAMKFVVISNVLTSQGIKLFRPGILARNHDDSNKYLIYVVGGLSILAIVICSFRSIILRLFPESYWDIYEFFPYALVYLPLIAMFAYSQTLMQRCDLLSYNLTLSLIGLGLKIMLFYLVKIETVVEFFQVLLLVDISILLLKLVIAKRFEKYTNSKFPI